MKPMLRARMLPARCSALVFALVALALGESSVTASELDAYRSFVRSPEARRLLVIARAAMEEALAPRRATAEVPTPSEMTRMRPAFPEPDSKESGTRRREAKEARHVGMADSTGGAPPTGQAARQAHAEPDWPGTPVGVYVSLVRGRETRACVGAPAPLRGTLSETVRALAREALRADRRHPPVRAAELPGLRLVLSFVTEGERVASPYAIDPGRQGLLIATARGSIAFLPGEARTIQWALREARRAGVIAGPGADAVYRRLESVTVSEPSSSPRKGEDDDAAP